MALLRMALVGCLLLAAASVGLAQKEKAKIDKTKLAGTWMFVKTTSKDAPPPGATMSVEFTKDGKSILTIAFKGKTSKATGTYSVKNDKLTMVLMGPGGKDKKETMTIDVLTDTKFVTSEKEDGKTVTTEFKKKK